MEVTFRAVVLSAAAFADVIPGVAAAQEVCGNTAVFAALPGTTIASMQAVPANATDGVPAFCEVRATISTVAGSRIGAVYRLPASWNGKVLGIGGGGSRRVRCAVPALHT